MQSKSQRKRLNVQQGRPMSEGVYDKDKEIEQLRFKNELLVDEIRTLHAEIVDLKIEKFRRFNEEECWIYQEDGDNYLESLVCPVVISAKKLIELGAK